LRSRAGLILSFTISTHSQTRRYARKDAEDSGRFLQDRQHRDYALGHVAMMKFLQTHSGQHSLIGLCMESRVLSAACSGARGSAFTFGAVDADADLKTAPGQISARDLRGIYRIDQIDAATRIYGVAGDPIGHSLSPVIMNTALRRENVNGVYLPLHAKTLKDLIHCVREIPLHGLSVTMPYKERSCRIWTTRMRTRRRSAPAIPWFEERKASFTDSIPISRHPSSAGAAAVD